ncbi:MAG TPA: hypothetical protein VFV57_08605 [Limnobacter sp.]|nr:hypothetical protein [Limnobacter sp.]
MGRAADWRIATPANRLSLGCSAPGEKVAILLLDEAHTQAGARWPWQPVEAGYLLIGNPQASWVDIKTHLRSLGRVQHHGSTLQWPWFSAPHMQTALMHVQPDEAQSWFGPLQAFVFLTGEHALWIKHQGAQVTVQELDWHPAH